MAITNYNELKTSIKNWLERSDIDSYIPDFITLAEKRIYRDLRLVTMETQLSVTISSGKASVPSDFLELKHARINGNPSQPLEVRDAEWIYRKYPTRSSDAKPIFVGYDSSALVFGPYPDSNYTVNGTYYAEMTSLSTTVTTNWFMDNAPDLLLFASLAEAEPFLGMDERVPLWELKYENIKKRLEMEDKRKKYKGSNLRSIAT